MEPLLVTMTQRRDRRRRLLACVSVRLLPRGLTEIATSVPAEDPVFGGLDRFAAARSVKAVGEQAGLRPPPHPHLLRHTFVSQLLAAGVPVREVQQLAGHASLATTQRYADAVNHSNRRVSKILRDRFGQTANAISTAAQTTM